MSELAKHPADFISTVARAGILLGAVLTLSASSSLVTAGLFKRRAALAALNDPSLGPVRGYLTVHPQAAAVLLLAVSLALLVSARGVQRRKPWARVVYMGWLAMFTLLIASSLMIQLADLVSFWRSAAGASAAIGASAPGPDASQIVILLVIDIVLVVMGALCGWIIRVLMTPAVRAEFATPRQLA